MLCLEARKIGWAISQTNKRTRGRGQQLFSDLLIFVAENGFFLDGRRLIEIRRRRKCLLPKALQSIKSRRVMIHVCETRAHPPLCLRKFPTFFWVMWKSSPSFIIHHHFKKIFSHGHKEVRNFDDRNGFHMLCGRWPIKKTAFLSIDDRNF